MTSSSRQAPEQAQHLVELLRARFFTRTDIVAARMPWGKPHPIEGGGTLDQLLDAHVQGPAAPRSVARYTNRRGATKLEKGRFRIGSYTPDAKGKTRWLCLDFDGADHADGLVDPKAAVLEAHRTCSELGVPAHIERSGGGKGWHLWVFFDELVSAKDARQLAWHVAPDDQLLVSGRLADARVNRGIEVFPKQDRVRKKKGFGNLVWLPFWSEAPEGANAFYRLDGKNLLSPYVPDALEPLDAAAFTRIVDSLMPSDSQPGSATDSVTVAASASAAADPSRAVTDDEAVQAFLASVDRLEAEAASDSAPSEAWAAWRKQALDALQLEEVYGPWLTGSYSGDHWLECRDPASPSGDRTPSAGVADGGGEAQRGTFRSFRDGRKLSVFDFMTERQMASSFGDAVRQVAEWTAVSLPGRPPTTSEPSRPTSSSRRGYPVIPTNARQLRDIITDARHVVNHTNGMQPFLFNRSGRPVRLVTIDGTPHIDYLDETAMYGVLVRIADWVRRTDEGSFDVTPPHDVSRDLVANTDPALPRLDAIVTAPMFDRAGSLTSAPGYHRDAGLWYHEPAGFSVLAVPDVPTPADVDRARSLLLDELLVDFPFVSTSDRAHAVAGILLPFVRRMIDGPTPIHLFEAPSPGAGKSLLADAITVIATGKQAEPTTIGRDDEETRKKITSVLSLGKPVILIDNVRSGIDSASLAAALTSDTWQDRILGQSKMVLLPNRAVWLVTANNPDLSLEIARRSVRVRIEPADDRPWKRKSFKHPQLISWAKKHRSELVHAVLVLVRAWLSGGRPAGTETLGSFESWAEVVGGILEAVGIDGFLGNADELYEEADREGQEWREFVAAWWEAFESSEIPAGDLLELAKNRDLLLSVIGAKSDRSQAIRLGKALQSNRNRQFGGHRIEVHSSFRKQKLWHLVEVRPEALEPGAVDMDVDVDDPSRVDVEPPTSTQHPHNIHTSNALESQPNVDVVDVVDVFQTPTRVIGQAHMHAHMRAQGEGPDHIHTHPHIHKADKIQGLGSVDVDVDVVPAHPHAPDPAPEINLADIEEDDT